MMIRENIEWVVDNCRSNITATFSHILSNTIGNITYHVCFGDKDKTLLMASST